MILESSEDILMAEVVCSSDDVVMGRIHVGSLESLKQAFNIIPVKEIDHFLIDESSRVPWISSSQVSDYLRKYVTDQQLVQYDFSFLKSQYLGEFLFHFQKKYKTKTLFIFSESPQEVRRLVGPICDFFEYIFIQVPGEEVREGLPSNCIFISHFQDWKDLDLEIDAFILLDDLSYLRMKKLFTWKEYPKYILLPKT